MYAFIRMFPLPRYYTNLCLRELNLQVTHPLPNHKNDFRTNRDDEIVFDKEAVDVLSRHFGADIDLYNTLAEETYV